MSTSGKGNNKGSEIRADDGEEEGQQHGAENAAADAAATPRRQQQPPQATRRSTRTRKRRAAASPTNGAESSSGDGDNDDNNSKPTKKKRRRAAVDEEETNDANINDTSAAVASGGDDDDDAPVKKLAAKDNENHDQKMQESSAAGVDSSDVNGGNDDDDEMKQQEENEEKNRKMPADGKVNGHHHATAATSTEATATAPPSVSFAALPAATANVMTSTTTTATRAVPVLPMATNLRLPHQHTPGKPLHETEILRQPPSLAAAAAPAAASMRLHLEASATNMANSPFTIPTPQPPRRQDVADQHYGMENGDGLGEVHQTTTTTTDSGNEQWHSPTAGAPLQQQQRQQAPLQQVPQQPPQQPKTSFGYLLKSTLVWCLLILFIQLACGSYWIHPFLSTIVDTSKGLIVRYKQIAWWGGQHLVTCSGQRLLSQERLLTLVGVTMPTADFVAISADHRDEKEEQVGVVVSTEDHEGDVELDDAELDKELEKELAEEQDGGEELDDQETDDQDDENAWMLELEKEDEILNDDAENFEIELPEEEPDDFGILDDGDGDDEFDIASIQDEEEEDDDDSSIKALLEAELEKDEGEEEDDDDGGIYNMTEKTNLMKKRLDDLEERHKVVVDERRKIRRDLESKKKALQVEKEAFTPAAKEVDGALDLIIEEGNNASEALQSKLADMNYLLEKLSETSQAEHVAGSEQLDACLEQMGKEYDGLLIDVSMLELWNVLVDDDDKEQCSSDEFSVFGRDQALKQIQEFQDEIANENHDMLNDETLRKSVEDWVTAYAATQPMPTRQKQKSIDSKAKRSSRAQNGPTVNAIKHMLAARLEFERADQTGRVDYAALYNGASVIRTGERATSPSLVDSLPIVNRLAAALRMRFYGHGPEAALTPTHPTTALGQCWAFGPDPQSEQFSSFASFSIRLAKPIFIERISIEHPSSLQVHDKIRTAIRSFRVLGFEDEQAEGTAWRLGSYIYEVVDNNSVNGKARLRQEYEIPNHINGVDIPRLRSISLAIDSNWGMSYSCLYRVRVHGSER